MAKISQISLDSISRDRLIETVRAGRLAVTFCRAPAVACMAKKISHTTITIR
jgi:hypothetical protein